MAAVISVLLTVAVGGVVRNERPAREEFDDFIWKFEADNEVDPSGTMNRLLSEMSDQQVLSSTSGDNIVSNKGEGYSRNKTLHSILASDTSEYVFDRNHILLKKEYHWVRQHLLTHLSPYIPTATQSPGEEDFSFYLIAGPAGQRTGVPMHRHADAVLLLLSGRKKWVVSRPGPLDKEQNEQFEVTQSKGEIVVVPEGWWHSVENEAVEEGEPIVAIGLQKLIPRTRELSTVVTASSLAADGRPADAITELLTNINHDTLGMISASLSTLYLRKGDDLSAFKWAETSLTKDPTLQEAIVNICTSSVHLERPQPAHRYCTKVTPKNALHHQTLAFYHLQMNEDIVKAINILRDFIPSCSDMSPCPQSIFYTLGKLLMATGEYDEAITALFEAYQMDTTNAAVIAALREVRDILAQRGEL